MGELKQKIEKVVERLKGEIMTLRTGRASPAIVEDIEVEYYGSKTPLKALASISSPEPRQLVIQPWDKNAVQPIESAIRNSSIGLSPVTDRDVIRLTIPTLTEETRRDLVKTLRKFLEESRIHIRLLRDEALKEIVLKEKAKKISEDEMFREKNEVQKIIDEANKKVESVGEAKEKEIMTV